MHSRLHKAIVVAGIAIACGGTGAGGSGASVDVLSGAGQTGYIGGVLPTGIRVRLRGASGAPLAGQAVLFRASDGGAAQSSTTISDADGLAETRWSLGMALGPQTLEVGRADPQSGAFVILASIGALARDRTQALTLLSGDGQTGTVGSSLAAPIELQVVGLSGHPAAGVPIRVDIDPSGSVDPAALVTGTDGKASLPWVMGTVAGTQRMTISVTDPVTDKVQGSLVVTATAVAGPGLSVGQVSLMASWEATGVALGTLRATAVVTDPYGNGVNGVEVAFIPGPGSGTASPFAVNTAVTTTSTGVVDGTASTAWRTGPLVGEQTLEARVAGAQTFVFRRTFTFQETLDGNWVATATWGSGDYFPGFCEGARSFYVAGGLVNSSPPVFGGPIGYDGTFRVVLGIDGTGLTGTMVMDGNGVATASGTIDEKYGTSVGSKRCAGTFTAGRQ